MEPLNKLFVFLLLIAFSSKSFSTDFLELSLVAGGKEVAKQRFPLPSNVTNINFDARQVVFYPGRYIINEHHVCQQRHYRTGFFLSGKVLLSDNADRNLDFKVRIDTLDDLSPADSGVCLDAKKASISSAHAAFSTTATKQVGTVVLDKEWILLHKISRDLSL